MKLFSIPNLFTLGNLLCGCLAIVFAFEGNLVWSAYLVGIACVFDFLDGFLARELNQHSPIGKELDSLADMVTFGVVPGVVMYKLITLSLSSVYSEVTSSPHPNESLSVWDNHNLMELYPWMKILPYVAFLIPLFSALRLAKFNVDTRQSDSFIGIPTPANSILICSLPLIMVYRSRYVMSHLELFGPGNGAMHSDPLLDFLANRWFLIALTIIMSILLIAEIPLFALKFSGRSPSDKNFGWKGNEIRYSFLALCVVLLATLQFVGIPLTIVLYVLMSVIHNLTKKKVASP